MSGKSRAYVNDVCITMLIFNPLHALFAAVPCEHVLQNEPRGGNNPTFRTNSKTMSHPNSSLGYLCAGSPSLTIQNDLATKCGRHHSQANQAVALASPSHRWSSDQVAAMVNQHQGANPIHRVSKTTGSGPLPCDALKQNIRRVGWPGENSAQMSKTNHR